MGQPRAAGHLRFSLYLLGLSQLATQTLSLAIGCGCLTVVVCERFRLPASLPLIAIGAALGRYGAHVIDADALGGAVESITAVIVGLLVFEGGLHLSREQLAKAPRALLGLLTVGVLLTFAGVATAAHYLVGVPWPIAALLGSVLVVTGPTVIQPMLRRLPLSPRLHTALAGEAILIDPIGVLLATAVAGLVVPLDLSQVGTSNWAPFLQLARPFVLGALVGLALGLASQLLFQLVSRRRRAPIEALSMLALATCMIAVGAGEAFAPEAGLVAATLCSIILANVDFPGVSGLREFKQRLATIFVATLFIILASRIDLMRLLNAPTGHWLFLAAIIFVVRPVSVFLATAGSRLGLAERSFMALIAPRGIVAASLGSLLAVELRNALAALPAARIGIGGEEVELASFESLVYLAVIGTITWSALAAPILARVLRVRAPARAGVVIIGAHPLARAAGLLLHQRNIPVHLVDSSNAKILAARFEGLPSSVGDATDTRWLDDHLDQPELGWLLPITGNDDVDAVAARWAEERFGTDRVLRPRLQATEAGVPGDLTRFLRDADEGHFEVDVGQPGQSADALIAVLAPSGGVSPVTDAPIASNAVVVFARRRHERRPAAPRRRPG